jgi:hypothetical protein
VRARTRARSRPSSGAGPFEETSVSAQPGVVASVLLAPLVDGPRQTLEVVHRSRAAWQLADGSGRVVLNVISPTAIRLPFAAVVPSFPRGSSLVSVGDGSLGWDGLRIRVARWFTPRRPSLPSLRRRLDPAAVRAFALRWSESVGRGDGLTPYADDVVCGALVALLAAGDPTAAAVAAEVVAAPLERRTTALSASLLRAAAGGYCIDPLADLLESLATPDGSTDAEHRRERTLLTLLAVGHSSGRGLAEGVFDMVGHRHASQSAA